MQDLFNQIKSNISQEMVIVGGVVLLLILILSIVIHSMRIKQTNKELKQLEARYAEFKGVPLSFKLNKATALSKVNATIIDLVLQLQEDFDKVQELLKEFSVSLAEIDDFVYSRKNRKAQETMKTLTPLIEQCEGLLCDLDAKLDQVLEQENTQRNNINTLKTLFRNIKKNYSQCRNNYRQSCEYIDVLVTKIENMFTIFEEWMYASEFNKANDKYNEINETLATLQILLDEIPPLYEKASVVLPMKMEETKLSAQSAMQRGVYLSHLDYDTNIELIQELNNTCLAKLSDCILDNISTTIKDCETRLDTLQSHIDKEEISFDSTLHKSLTMFQFIKELNDGAQSIRETYERVYERFGFENLQVDLDKLNEDLDVLNASKMKVENSINEKNVPYSIIILSFDDVEEKAFKIEKLVKQIKIKLDNATSDEERAKKQLIKLQLIVNEMRTNIVKNKLPSIDVKFEDDVRNANIFIIDIKEILSGTPLDVVRLNVKLEEAIDYIYTLYNSVNNLVSMASMVEHAIVYGNKYRSRNTEIDSELTRAELCFSNGQYTRALKISITAIEKHQPGAYSKIVGNNGGGESYV